MKDTIANFNRKLAFQNEEKKKRAAELLIANKELAFQNEEKGKRAAELIIAGKELVFQSGEKKKRAAELIVANKELVFQNEEKKKRAAELIIANEELVFQNEEKEKRAAELGIANIELAFQNEEKEKRALEKEKRAEELIIANKELAFQNKEKEKRAAELGIANIELAFQNEEKGKRADELIIANKELAFQNEEKEKRASEKERRAEELIIANKELAFQNQEKEKRAAELGIANIELAFQNKEKEKRAAELGIANTELAFQNEEKEKLAAELIIANKVLKQFAYVASHDLQEPLRTVSNYMQVFKEDYSERLDETARQYLHSVNSATKRMSMVIESLLDFSRLGHTAKLVYVDCAKLIDDVIVDLDSAIKNSNTSIEVTEMPKLNVYETEIRQVFQNLITNAIKFHRPGTQPKVKVSAERVKEEWRFSVKDTGIGIAPVHFERVFDIFQRLHTSAEYEGNGIGLANCKKIIQLHKGEIWLESSLGQGTTVYFTIPNLAV